MGGGGGLHGSRPPFRPLEAFGVSQRVTVVNSLEAFRAAPAADRPLFYRYDMHLNARGARVYARAVAAGLRRSGALAGARC